MFKVIRATIYRVQSVASARQRTEPMMANLATTGVPRPMDPPMATMNVSIHDPTETWIEERTRDGSFSNASDHVRHLIRRDQEQIRTVAQIQAAIPEGGESGNPRPFDPVALKRQPRRKAWTRIALPRR